MCSQPVSPVTPAMIASPGPAADLVLRLLSQADVSVESPVVQHKELTGNGWQWTGEGELGRFSQVGSEQVWYETGPAQRHESKHQLRVLMLDTSKHLTIYLEDGTEAIYPILLQISICVLWLAPCSPSATHTRAHKHTHNDFFVGVAKRSTGSCTPLNAALFASRAMMDHCGEA